MNKTKRIHTFYVMVDEELSSFWGNYEEAKKQVLDFLDKLDGKKIIGILWTYQDYSYNPRTDKYTGNSYIHNVISNCGRNPLITVDEAIEKIKRTKINGEIITKKIHTPERIDPEDVDILDDLKDE